MQNLKYNYRLYPNKAQINQLDMIIGGCRFVWNYFLELEIKQYKKDKTFRFYHKNSQDLTALKKVETWLNEIPSTTLQQTLRNLERALKSSFKKNTNSSKGFPKFKKKKFDKSFDLTMVNSARNCKIPNKFIISKVFFSLHAIFKG